LLAAAEEVALAEHDRCLIAASGSADGAGAKFDTLDLTEVFAGPGNDPSTEASVNVDLIGRDAGQTHSFHNARGDAVLRDDEGLKAWYAGRDNEIYNGVRDFEEAIAVNVPLTGGDQEQAGKGEVEETGDGGGIYLNGYNGGLGWEGMSWDMLLCRSTCPAPATAPM
jgi:hypothetical protein